MSRSIGYLIVAGLAIGTPLRGQDIAALARRLDSTNRVSIAVRDSLVAYRAAHPASYGEYSDSVVVAGGKVKLLFNEAVAATARGAAVEADRQIAEFGAAVQRLTPFVFSIVPNTSRNAYERRFGGAISVRQHDASDPANPNRTSSPDDARSIAIVITSAVTTALTAASASRITDWTHGSFPLTPGLVPKPDWALLRLALVSSPSFLGKSCYLGDVRACRVFLGLDTVSDPARMLFDSTGRRLAVEYERDRMTRASRVATQRCLAGNDEACVTLLDLAGASPLSSPYMRGSLIMLAVDLGEAHAVERLVVTPGSARDAIAGAANQPIDSVVAVWQRHTTDRAGGRALPLVVAISSIAWVAVCLFLALRSSRWR